MKSLKILFVFLLMLGVVLGSIKIYNERRYHIEKQTHFMMDTFVTIYAVGPQEITSKGINLAFDRMQDIAVKFNSLDPKSPVYLFNKDGVPVTDSEIVGLIKIALKVSRETKGAFDITVAPLMELWGFYTKNYRIPEISEIQECLEGVGYQHLILNNGELKKDIPGVKIDLGGVAKGFALQEGIKILKSNGINSALIDCGGDVYALGKKGGHLWKVGIKDPRSDALMGYVETQDIAVMGSGDYERFFIKDGKRYHHIFNPKTGYPAQGAMSVTLIYADPVLGQILSKIPFLLGAKGGLDMLEKIPGMEAIIVAPSGEKIYSSSLKHTLKVISQ